MPVFHAHYKRAIEQGRVLPAPAKDTEAWAKALFGEQGTAVEKAAPVKKSTLAKKVMTPAKGEPAKAKAAAKGKTVSKKPGKRKG